MKKLALCISVSLLVVGLPLIAFDKARLQKSNLKPIEPVKVIAISVAQPQVNPHQAPHASQADFQAIINAEVAKEIEDLLRTTLAHPILGTNRDDFLAALNAYRKALITLEKDPRIQALPTKTELHAQAQNLAKRSLTQDEKDGLLYGVSKLKNAGIYTFYLNTHPDVEHDAAFFEQVKASAQ